jgi:hypothetical protein
MRLIDRSIYAFLCCWLSVDIALGFVAYMTGAVFVSDGSIVFRGLFFLLVLVRCLSFLNNMATKILILFLFAFILLLNIHIYIMDSSQLLYSLKTGMKVLLPILSAVVIYQMALRGSLDFRRFRIIIAVNVLALFCNSVAFYFGLGISNYGHTSDQIMRGGSGFIYAGNEVAGLLLALYPLALLTLCSTKVKEMLVIMCFGLSAVSLFSKTAIIGVVILTLAYILKNYKYSVGPLAIAIVVVVGFNLQKMLDYFSLVALMSERWVYFVSEYGFNVFMGGGAKRLAMIQSQLADIALSPWRIFIGFGWTGEAENNLMDLLYGYGLLGILIYLMWMSAFIVPLITSRRALGGPSSLISLSLLMLAMVATLAGHVVQSGMISVFWGMLISYQCVLENSNKKGR